MSFILDALKKSAAERQLGEVPSLQPAGDIGSTPVRNYLARPIVIVMVLLVATTAGYFWFTKSQDSATNSQAQTNPGSEVTAENIETPETAELPDYHLVEKLPEYRPPVNKQSPLVNYTPPAQNKAPVQNKAVVETPAADTVNAETAAVDEQNTAKKASQKALTEQQRIARLKKQRAAESAEDAALVAAVEKRLAAEKKASAQRFASASGAQKLKSNRMSLGELPAAVRSKIPDIKISMQVYATEPANRFVIIDGTRYRQHDQIAEEVTLDEILRQGIILKYRQYRVFIK